MDVQRRVDWLTFLPADGCRIKRACCALPLVLGWQLVPTMGTSPGFELAGQGGMRSCDAAKLARVLGLLGSEYAGERAAAALAAHRLMRRLGLSWQDLLLTRGEAERDTSRSGRGTPAPHDELGATQSRLRQCQRGNNDLRKQITRLQRRMESFYQHPPPPKVQE